MNVIVSNNFEGFIFFSPNLNWCVWGGGMLGGCFTDVVLHSLKNFHQAHATEPSRLPKDVVAAWGAVILRFHGVSSLY